MGPIPKLSPSVGGTSYDYFLFTWQQRRKTQTNGFIFRLSEKYIPNGILVLCQWNFSSPIFVIKRDAND